MNGASSMLSSKAIVGVFYTVHHDCNNYQVFEMCSCCYYPGWDVGQATFEAVHFLRHRSLSRGRLALLTFPTSAQRDVDQNPPNRVLSQNRCNGIVNNRFTSLSPTVRAHYCVYPHFLSSEFKTLRRVPSAILRRPVSWSHVARGGRDIRKPDADIWRPHACLLATAASRWCRSCEGLLAVSVRTILRVLSVGLSLLV